MQARVGRGTAAAVVVTGASRGIGRECALVLADEGYLVFGGVRNDADADALAAANGSIRPLRLDVTDPVSLEAAAESVGAAVGDRGLAGLVNNAGVVVAGPLEQVSLDDLRRQFEVNVLGTVAVTQRFLPLLRRGRGRLVNVSSMAGVVALPFMGPYSASKFALAALSDSLRVELRPLGVGVSVIEAGAIATDLWEQSFAAASARVSALPEEAQSLYGSPYAQGRALMARYGRRAMPPRVVARAVARALGARRPRSRYRVGRGSTLLWLCSLLPVRVRDRLFARALE